MYVPSQNHYSTVKINATVDLQYAQLICNYSLKKLKTVNNYSKTDMRISVSYDL